MFHLEQILTALGKNPKKSNQIISPRGWFSSDDEFSFEAASLAIF